MGELFRQRPVKLIASLIFKEEARAALAEKMLLRAFGATSGLKKELPFDFTDYYSREFGSPLARKVICFNKLVSVEGIERIKLATNAMEDKLKVGAKRTVNIDPGYITEAKLVLLTTKDYTHRVHIGRHIFAESTLYFKDSSFRAWPWTYPDYASPAMVEYFNAVRALYVEDIKGK